jgi:hypothetical protein
MTEMLLFIKRMTEKAEQLIMYVVTMHWLTTSTKGKASQMGGLEVVEMRILLLVQWSESSQILYLKTLMKSLVLNDSTWGTVRQC